MIQKFNIKNNTYIRYDVIGKGPPILLLHTIRNRLEYSYKVSDLLRKEYTLYILELPGFGDSPINITTKYDQEFFTNCVVDFIKENKLANKIPIIAVPTTAGTGSEETHFATVYYKKKKLDSYVPKNNLEKMIFESNSKIVVI